MLPIGLLSWQTAFVAEGRAVANSFFESEVIKTVQRLAPGEVASYGEIAEEAGFPGAARAVGNVLSRNVGLPWWRVVRANGSLVSSHEKEQGRLLRKEGVRIVQGKIAEFRSRP